MNVRKLIKKINLRWFADIIEKIGSRSVLASSLVFLLASIFVIGLTLVNYGYKGDFSKNILVEAHGMLFDILIIGIFIFALHKLGEKRLENRRYQEEIDDFSGWKAQEAKYRIIGNIKRLNRNGISKIHITQSYLKKANLAFINLQEADLTATNLQEAFLYETNLQNATLALANLQRAELIGTNLKGANLLGADLRGAIIVSVEQFSEVETMYDAKLDSNLNRQIEKKYPYLLERPKWLKEESEVGDF